MSDPDSLLPPATPAVRRLRFLVLVTVLAIVAALLVGFFLHRRNADRAHEIRAQISEAIATADGMRSAVALYRARNGGAGRNDPWARMLRGKSGRDGRG